MSNAKFELFRSNSNNEYYFRLKAGNGEIILSSEGYTTKQSCLNGIDSVKENSPLDDRYNRLESRNGQYYFTLIARNGEIIGKSETYTSTTGRENGITSVKQNAPRARVVELV